MWRNTRARVRQLERKLAERRQQKMLVVRADLEQPGIFWEHDPWRPVEERGRQYTRAELDTMQDVILFIVYRDDWRQVD